MARYGRLDLLCLDELGYVQIDPRGAELLYPLFGLTVGSYTELQHWVERLTSFDVEHGAVRQAHRGWAVTVTGPDLVRIQLQTDEGPSGEDE